MGEKINGNPIDILLVEDNEADVKITLRAFEQAKIKNNIHVVSDGEKALDYIFKKDGYEDAISPDLVLLDINLPKVDGFEVLKAIKGDKNLSIIPVIMLTSSKNEEDIVKSYGNGAASYIPKPVSFEDFIKVVDCFNFYWHIINKLPFQK